MINIVEQQDIKNMTNSFTLINYEKYIYVEVNKDNQVKKYISIGSIVVIIVIAVIIKKVMSKKESKE